MDTRHLSVVALACGALLGADAAQAQVRHITLVPQAPRQAPAPGVTTFGLPNPTGLPSPVPAGLTPPGSPNLSSPGTAPGSPAIDAGVAVPLTAGGGAVVIQQPYAGAGTNVMGAGPAMSRGPYSAVEMARAFMEADTNHDGELSRAEAARLSIVLPMSFDDLDRDHDGSLSRFEYEDAFK